MAAAAAQESTVQILNSIRPKDSQTESSSKAAGSSFIEDVDLWVQKYLNLADEVLQSPAEPEDDSKESAA